jgi:hypothetical protein
MIRRCLLLLAVVAGCGSDEVGGPPAATESAAAGDTAEVDDPAGGDQSRGAATGGFGQDDLGAFVNPCDVLSEDAVSAATGLTVTGTEDQGPLGCVWFVEKVDPDILADDAITWQPFPPEQFAAQQQAIDQGLDGEEIPGLGNAAVFIGTEALGEVWVSLDELSFRVGNQFAFGNYDARPAQEALARALVDTLG